MDRKAKAQKFKDKRMQRMTGKKSMPNVPPARDPRVDGIKNPAGAGEQKTQLEARVSNMRNTGGKLGPRPSGYKQSMGPGLLNG